MVDIKELLLQWLINFLIKKSSGSGITNETISNKELGEELHKAIIRNFNKRKVHSLFMDDIWNDMEDFADMLFVSKFNKGFSFYIMCYWYL